LLLKIEGEKARRAQIAWVNEAGEVLVLANQFGHRERALDVDTMARLLCSGAAVPLAEAADPALDRAQYVMLQGLHDQLLYQSIHDPLTGLINRVECDAALARALADAKRTDSRHVLCFIDIDKFSVINTTCGHGAGDQVLKAVAALIKEQLSGKGVLARLGSDEFGLLLEDCSLDDALDLAEKQIQAAEAFRFEWEDKRLPIGLSIGIVPLNASSDSVGHIWRAAESSCRLARDLGGHRLQVYHSGHARLSHQDMMMKWVGKIDQMLDRDQLFLRCQRIVRIDDSDLERPHFEILLGVRDGLGEVHSPQHFIEAAEWYQRMPAIDRWVARHALDWMSRNDATVRQVEGFAINLSGQSVTDDGFADFLIGELDRTQVPRDKVYFEVTETVGISNLGDAAAFMEKVKEAGCKFSLDDFGSGMSSYAYLKNLPVDVVKIDGAFVKNMDVNASDYAVVKSVCEVAHFMEKKVVAEFVGSEAVLELLREIGVDYAQGYFIEKPVALDGLIVG
jgi:diguanylate cyclase (GGDEF)-like protein